MSVAAVPRLVLNLPDFDALATVSTGVTQLPPTEAYSCVYLDIVFVISVDTPDPVLHVPV